MSTRLQWYDSLWLEDFLAAKEIIARTAPARLRDFVESFRILRTDPTFIVKEAPGVLDEDARTMVKESIRSIPVSAMETHELARFGRLVVHNHAPFTAMQQEFAPLVCALVGEEVEPSYNFLSLYTRMGVCEPHLDAPFAKWTLDICIDQSDPWPIYFSPVAPWPEEWPSSCGDGRTTIKNDLEFQSKTLTPGDGIVFSGSSQWHYRDAIDLKNSSAFCDLLFFHYIPKGAGELVSPRNWARLFGVPELANVPNIERH